MLWGSLSREADTKDAATHIAFNILKNIRLERHVHVYSPNDKTGLPFRDVQHSWDQFWRSFGIEGQWDLASDHP